MNYKKFTKITSGTLLLPAVSSLASQAQGGVTGTSGLAQNGASKAFLQKGTYGSESAWRILKILGVSVVAVILVVGISAYCLKKSHENKLSQIDALIEEIKNLKPESFSGKGVGQVDAIVRNMNLVNSLEERAKSFLGEKTEDSFSLLKKSANEIPRGVTNISGYKDDIKKCELFLCGGKYKEVVYSGAKEFYEGLKNKCDEFNKLDVKKLSYYYDVAQLSKETIEFLDKWKELNFYTFGSVDVYLEAERLKNLEASLKGAMKGFGQALNLGQSDVSGHLGSLSKYLKELGEEIVAKEADLADYKKMYNAGVEHLDEGKKAIIAALENSKKEKEEKGIFGSLWGSNQPVLNENNQQ